MPEAYFNKLGQPHKTLETFWHAKRKYLAEHLIINDFKCQQLSNVSNSKNRSERLSPIYRAIYSEYYKGRCAVNKINKKQVKLCKCITAIFNGYSSTQRKCANVIHMYLGCAKVQRKCRGGRSPSDRCELMAVAFLLETNEGVAATITAQTPSSILCFFTCSRQ